MVESVYSAVRTDSLYKTDYVLSLERLLDGLHEAVNGLYQGSAHFLRQRATSVVVGGFVGSSCKNKGQWRA